MSLTLFIRLGGWRWGSKPVTETVMQALCGVARRLSAGLECNQPWLVGALLTPWNVQVFDGKGFCAQYAAVSGMNWRN
jgi:hypothetical protein